MASTKEIKRRIKSVKNTKKITKAMELVAASKMKRAVSATLASRLYAEYSWEVLTSIANSAEEISHPLFGSTSSPQVSSGQVNSNKTLLVLITSNRGLCGAYNAQVIKKTLSFLKQNMSKMPFDTNSQGEAPMSKGIFDILTVGKKGDAAMRRIGANIVASFTELPDNPTLRDIMPISKMLVDEYTAGKYDKVLVAYTDFVSALTQKPNIKQILPISKAELKEMLDSVGESSPRLVEEGVGGGDSKTNYVFEGDMHTLLGSLAEKLTRMQIYQMMLESGASEQSARMVAMKNASEASGEMISDLTLVFNKARQAGITQEISEISAGMVSIS